MLYCSFPFFPLLLTFLIIIYLFFFVVSRWSSCSTLRLSVNQRLVSVLSVDLEWSLIIIRQRQSMFIATRSIRSIFISTWVLSTYMIYTVWLILSILVWETKKTNPHTNKCLMIWLVQLFFKSIFYSFRK